MSFHVSAENIRVDDGHILRAALRNENGDLNETEIDLNNCLGNNDGHFEWNGNGTLLPSSSFFTGWSLP